MKKELTEEEKNELWMDDKFCLEKERQKMKLEDMKIQRDYAHMTGRNFFDG